MRAQPPIRQREWAGFHSNYTGGVDGGIRGGVQGEVQRVKQIETRSPYSGQSKRDVAPDNRARRVFDEFGAWLCHG